VAEPPAIPAPPKDDGELLKLQYQAQVDNVTKPWRDAVDAEVAAEKAVVDAQAAALKATADADAKTLEVQRAREDTTREVMRTRVDADREAEIELVKAVHDAYIEVTKGSLDRSLKRAEYLVTVTTGITGVYTALLGLVYSVGKDGTPNPLPPRGVIPVVFLGLGLILSAFYMAFLRRTTIKAALLPTGIGGTLPEERLRTFFTWTFSGVLDRAWALRMAVVSLGLGLALLPLPFLAINHHDTRNYTIAAAAVLAAWALGEIVWALIPAISRRRDDQHEDVPVPPAR
jgi:hypothetical protein